MKSIFVSSVLLAGLLSEHALAGSAIGDAATSTPVIKTSQGAIQGLTRDGVRIFLGIPYAAPPVGELRWRPPSDPKPWKGTRNTTSFASTCPQVTTFGPFGGPTSIDEDCLYLNVFTTGPKKSSARKPVIVWFHGGGNILGGSNDYDGSKLAKGGPLGVESVVVTLNYRMGLFGVFSHPSIDKGELYGNYLTLDHQAALRWVQRNITAFGGDPGRVTISGQSAGSTDVMVNLLSPLSKGLFQGAIVESSPGYTAWLPTAQFTRGQGLKFAEAAGCPGSDDAAAACLRALPAARILQLQGTLAGPGPYTTGYQFVDGTIVPMMPEMAWSSGSFNRVPLLGGAAKDEASFFAAIAMYFNASAGVAAQPPRTALEFARATAPGAFCIYCNADRRMPPGVADAYPLSDYGNDPLLAYVAVASDGGRCRELHVLQDMAAYVPVYAYDFTYRDAPFYYPKYPGLKPDAAHTIDIQFVFKGYHGGHLGVNLDQFTGQPRGLNEAETRLSDQMIAQWTKFAASGNPNGSGDAPWPRFERNGTYMVQDVPLANKSVAAFRAEHKCDFFDPQLFYRTKSDD